MEKVGLVLSGGAAYGFAHIGVINVLLKNKIPIDIVTGTSMGALIGGLYASGVKPKEMKNILTKFSGSKIVDFNLFALSNGGLIHGKKVLRFLSKLTEKKKIEDCKIPFCAVSCDLKTGKKISINTGDIAEAIRASISVPGIFQPVVKDDMVLVDGGCVDNIPVDDARKLGATKIIAVDVCSFYKPHKKLKSPVDILISAGNVMTSQICRYKKNTADITIKIAQPNVFMEKFNPKNTLQAIKNGEKEAKQVIDDIKKMLNL